MEDKSSRRGSWGLSGGWGGASSMVPKSLNCGLKTKGEPIRWGCDRSRRGSVIGLVVDESKGTPFQGSSSVFPNARLNAISPISTWETTDARERKPGRGY